MAAKRGQAPEPHPDLIEAVKNRKVVPFIGAGFSKSAEPKESSSLAAFIGMPTYTELLERLLKKANIREDDKRIVRNYLKRKDSEDPNHNDEAAAVLRKAMGKWPFFIAIRDILEPIDEEIEGSLAHKFLSLLNFRRIVTTNYDRLIEGFSAPRHEMITPDDEMSCSIFIEDDRRSSILKLHGDITRPNKIPWGRPELLRSYGYDSYNEPLPSGTLDQGATNRLEILKRIFKENTVLFLGTSLSPSEGFSQVLMNLVRDMGGLPHRHYALVPHSRKLHAFRQSLAEQMNIELQYYRPDPKHSQVWEFLSLLKAGRPESEIKPGQQWQQWYLQKERHEYLLAQLDREKTATSARYLTPKLTNAIATGEYIEVDCRDELKGRYSLQIINAVIVAMSQRVSNLERRLQQGGLEVRVLFLEQELRKSLDSEKVKKEKLMRTLERYRRLLFLTETTDLEVRVIPDMTSDELKRQEASFALIFNRNDGQPMADVTIAYSSQATNDFPEIHMVHINTSEIWKHTFTFERFWSAAKNENETKLLIKALIEQAM